ncbi:hypothetical protein PIN31115_04416 [Pandoraea iniqua]|uniref:Uncharacterized protein n=1 Tax=Pandoraea iniqua TaxID=2508288 RepID=A0A5E4YDG0_9BURK|nr:hypothetical protein [Pandoraea iniqua]VVE46482.1 hypothetical protein PIN31115_04416 [Pandoraea iniqua]
MEWSLKRSQLLVWEMTMYLGHVGDQASSSNMSSSPLQQEADAGQVLNTFPETPLNSPELSLGTPDRQSPRASVGRSFFKWFGVPVFFGCVDIKRQQYVRAASSPELGASAPPESRYPQISKQIKAWIAPNGAGEDVPASRSGLGLLLIERLTSIDLSRDALIDMADPVFDAVQVCSHDELERLAKLIEPTLNEGVRRSFKLTPNVPFAAVSSATNCASWVRLDMALQGALKERPLSLRGEWKELVSYVMNALQRRPWFDNTIYVDLTPYSVSRGEGVFADRDESLDPYFSLLPRGSQYEKDCPQANVVYLFGTMSDLHTFPQREQAVPIARDRMKRYLDVWMAEGGSQVAVDYIHTKMNTRAGSKDAGIYNFSGMGVIHLPRLLELHALCSRFVELDPIKQIVVDPPNTGVTWPNWLTENFNDRTREYQALYQGGQAQAQQHALSRRFCAIEHDPF